MGIIHRLFGKRASDKDRHATVDRHSSTQARPYAPEAARKGSAPPPGSVQDGLVKVNELTVKLGKYYQAHATPDNELLFSIASDLTAHSLALTHLLTVRQPVLAETQVSELLRLLKGTRDESELRQALDRRGLRTNDAGNVIMKYLNMYFEVGTKLLLKREMKERGIADAIIEQAVCAARPNVF